PSLLPSCPTRRSSDLPPAALDFNAKAYRPLTIQGCPPCSNEKRQKDWRSPKASPARDLSPLAPASWTAAVPLPLWISAPKLIDQDRKSTRLNSSHGSI